MASLTDVAEVTGGEDQVDGPAACDCPLPPSPCRPGTAYLAAAPRKAPGKNARPRVSPGRGVLLHKALLHSTLH